MATETLQIPDKVLGSPAAGGMPTLPDLGAQFKEEKGKSDAYMKQAEAATQKQAAVKEAGAAKLAGIQKEAPAEPKLENIGGQFEHKGMDPKWKRRSAR